MEEMMRSLHKAIAILAIPMLLGGCGTGVHPFSGTIALTTKADARLATAMEPKEFNPLSGVTPQRIQCIEPSPDIAKAFSSAFDMGTSVDVGALPVSGVDPIKGKIENSISRSRAEALAQLRGCPLECNHFKCRMRWRLQST